MLLLGAKLPTYYENKNARIGTETDTGFSLDKGIFLTGIARGYTINRNYQVLGNSAPCATIQNVRSKLHLYPKECPVTVNLCTLKSPNSESTWGIFLVNLFYHTTLIIAHPIAYRNTLPLAVIIVHPYPRH